MSQPIAADPPLPQAWLLWERRLRRDSARHSHQIQSRPTGRSYREWPFYESGTCAAIAPGAATNSKSRPTRRSHTRAVLREVGVSEARIEAALASGAARQG